MQRIFGIHKTGRQAGGLRIGYVLCPPPCFRSGKEPFICRLERERSHRESSLRKSQRFEGYLTPSRSGYFTPRYKRRFVPRARPRNTKIDRGLHDQQIARDELSAFVFKSRGSTHQENFECLLQRGLQRPCSHLLAQIRRSDKDNYLCTSQETQRETSA